MAKKKYIYSKLTTENSSFFKRFTHNKRFTKALSLTNLTKETKILDFGTGDGHFLNLIYNEDTSIVYGYEPIKEMFTQLQSNIDNKEIKLINHLDEVSNLKFDVVYCLEVLEHFYKDYQIYLLNQIKNQLAINGLVVVSVPIEVGIASFIKNTIRVAIQQFERDTNFKNMVKALFYRHVDRSTEGNYIFSHIGFNYKTLDKIFKEAGFTIVKKDFSPFKILRGLNSQVFYVLKMKQ
ncbi:class I SAM-dependent methyltransferase [uncultured Polaribacter sp.]|uniref:class I SAM-dependent methyltransferase n=1 Tax=uncultured Polaribacter sp. TaxID=174711 RepID=UPI00263207EA|nr:class I SAM-dependent methyltransferase [uncultured Polaribacter sp.]